MQHYKYSLQHAAKYINTQNGIAIQFSHHATGGQDGDKVSQSNPRNQATKP
jgi:hypothetical protein